MRQFWKKYRRWVIAFSLLAALFLLFPLTHDDWDWGTDGYKTIIANGFQDYGGRYLSYLMTIVVTHLPIVRAIFEAFVITGIAICIEKIVRAKWAFYVTLLLLGLMPAALFAGAVAWASGFVNYLTSALLTLILALRIFKIMRGESVSQKWYVVLGYFLIGAANSLIVEHSTIYGVCISIAALIYLYKKQHRLDAGIMAFALGAVGGAVAMFINPTYHRVATGEDFYRSTMRGGVIWQLVKNYFGSSDNTVSIYRSGFLDFVVVNLTILGALVVNRFGGKTKRSKICDLALVIYGAFVVYSLVMLVFGVAEKSKYFMLAEGIITGVAALAMVVSVCAAIRGFKQKALRAEVVYVLIALFFLIAPFFVVNPISPRCFANAYIYLILLVCLLWRAALIPFEKSKVLNSKQWQKRANSVWLVSLAGVYLTYVAVFGFITIANIQRKQSIQRQLDSGAEEVEITHLPFEEFTYRATPLYQHEGMKRYYGIPLETKIVFK